MNKLSSSDRVSLLRVASSLPVGDETRRAILSGLQRVSAEYSDLKLSDLEDAQKGIDHEIKFKPFVDEGKASGFKGNWKGGPISLIISEKDPQWVFSFKGSKELKSFEKKFPASTGIKKIWSWFFKEGSDIAHGLGKAAAKVQKDLDESKPVIMYGLKGVKSTPGTKKFKNLDAFDKWAESEDAGNWTVQSVENA